MSLLCRIGLHKWREHFLKRELYLKDYLRECSRCGLKQRVIDRLSESILTQEDAYVKTLTEEEFLKLKEHD